MHAVPQVALAAANERTSLRPDRLLFKHRQLLEGDESLQTMLDSLSSNSTQDRRLLQSTAGATGIHIQLLGAHSGVSMVQVPEGVSKADLLRALQAHPGLQTATVQSCFSSFMMLHLDLASASSMN